MKVDEEIGEVAFEAGVDESKSDDAVSIPASLEAYIGARTDDAPGTVAKLIQECAQTGLWNVVTAPLEASVNMRPCPFGASLLLRRTNGLLGAAIVGQNWSVTLLGDEAWVDVMTPRASALALIGKPVRTRIEIPFLSPTLNIVESTQVGSFYRFHCQ